MIRLRRLPFYTATLLFFAVAAVITMNSSLTYAIPAGDTNQPVELGAVNWNRGFDDALRESTTTGKPVFAFFQEVPGCSTCRNFGNGPLSHPLLVEAVEDLFIPVLIYNNKAVDEALLKRFDEPSWNNPIVRFLNSDGNDLITRRDGVYDTHGIATRMIDTLRKAGNTVPQYLDLLAAETAPQSQLSTATLEMYCYWEGEGRLGDLPGVINTKAGWHNNREVVHLQYDADIISHEQLFRLASSFKCADRIFVPTETQKTTGGQDNIEVQAVTPRDAKNSDRKHAMLKHPHRYLPLTPAQATKVNAALFHGRDAGEYMSPRQRELLKNHIRPALAKDPDAFEGMTRPENHTDLASYEHKLREHLETLSDHPTS